MEKLQKLRSIKKAFQISETLFIYLICLVLNFLYAIESISTENISAKTGIKIYGSIKLPKTLYINDEKGSQILHILMGKSTSILCNTLRYGAFPLRLIIMGTKFISDIIIITGKGDFIAADIAMEIDAVYTQAITKITIKMIMACPRVKS